MLTNVFPPSSWSSTVLPPTVTKKKHIACLCVLALHTGTSSHLHTLHHYVFTPVPQIVYQVLLVPATVL